VARAWSEPPSARGSNIFQRGVLEELSGYIPLSADGELRPAKRNHFPPLAFGLLAQLWGVWLAVSSGPHALGTRGAANAMIEAFQFPLHGGVIPLAREFG